MHLSVYSQFNVILMVKVIAVLSQWQGFNMKHGIRFYESASSNLINDLFTGGDIDQSLESDLLFLYIGNS